MEPIIGHIDMDAFFASVEERDKPFLKGLPVVIGSDPQDGRGRGVVSTANYEARKIGIHSAMPITRAWKLCEEHRTHNGVRCVFITAGAGKYTAASREVFAIVARFVPFIEQVSVDEAYLDLSFCETYDAARALAQDIKNAITTEASLTASVGIGPNKMVAKIASDHEKPNGLTVVLPENVEIFLEPLPIRTIPGIGKVTGAKFARLGFKTIKDAQRYSWEELQRLFGKHGFSIWERVRGIDSREVETERAVSKSIGKHYTFDVDTHHLKEVQECVRGQVKSIYKEVQSQGFVGFRTVVITIRFSDFTTHTRSLTVPEALTTEKELELKALKLLLPFFEKKENPNGLAVRLVGVRVEKLI